VEPDRRPTAAGRAGLHGSLRSWYREHRRDLPWRSPPASPAGSPAAASPAVDPYGIWVSEAMLQQTRVETARDYWLRFVAALPTVEALAAAPEEQVLALWSGLGYYRRARSLQAAARVLVEVHGGVFPRTRSELLALPGVGPYTAGAVLSIAFDLPEPLVDGNVTRVLARLFALRGDASRAAFRRALWDLAARLMPTGGGAGDWNQALMELGATVCLPRKPDCGACPLRRPCRARREGLVERLPELPPRPVSVAVDLVALLAERGGRLLLERRPDSGRMAGMWQLPTAERAVDGSPLTGLFPPALPAGLRVGPELGFVRHAITRHRIRLGVHRPAGSLAGVAAGPLPGADGGALAWVAPGALDDLPLTGMARKVLRSSFAPAALGGRRPLRARSAGSR